MATILPRNSRYESLDLWRGVACLSVVVYHSVCGYIMTPVNLTRIRGGHKLIAPESYAWVQGEGGSLAEWIATGCSYLWAGVPLFFVISGYCIVAAADSSRRKPHPGMTFFWRRFRRIYPPLWAFLAVTAAVISLVPDFAMPASTRYLPDPLPRPSDLTFAQWFGSISLTEEWRANLGGPPKRYFAGQLWTLCYEEQFYVVIGLIVMVARRWLFPLVAVVTGLVFLNVIDLNTVFGVGPGIDLNAYQLHYGGFFFDGLWLAFAAGIGVYYRVNYATPVAKCCLDCLLILGALLASRNLPSYWAISQDLSGSLTIAFPAALLLGWLHTFDAALATARFTAPLRWAGRMCYSLYLVHAPIALLIQGNLYRLGYTSARDGLLISLPLTLAISLALSWAFHRAVEKRFLNPPLIPTPADSKVSETVENVPQSVLVP